MPRLPQPGHDHGTWGAILNDFLSQTLQSDGTIKDAAVTSNNLAPNSVTSAALASNAVTAAIIQDGTITEALLDTALRAKVNASAADLSGKLDKVIDANQVYITDGSGNQSTRNFSINPVANSIAQRSAGGVIAIGTPTDASHAATKAYADTKVAQTSSATRLYGTDASGNQVTYAVGQSAVSGAIPARDAGGQFLVGTPTNASHPTTKSYVDAADATKLDKVAVGSRTYVTDANGIQTHVPFTHNASSNSMVYRDGNGRFRAAAPLDTTHVANKDYVDSTRAPAVPTQSEYILNRVTIQTHPESPHFNNLLHMFNDIAYNVERGGSISLTRNGVAEPIDTTNLFLPDVTYSGVGGVQPADVFVIEVGLCRSFTYTTRVGIVMSDAFRCRDVTIEAWDIVAAAWISVATRTDEAATGHFGAAFQPGNGGANPINKLRFTLSDFTDLPYGVFRITSIYAIGYNSTLLRETFLSRGGGQLYGPIRHREYATASRPSASTSGKGTQIFDATLNKPLWSDGTNWRDAAGSIV